MLYSLPLCIYNCAGEVLTRWLFDRIEMSSRLSRFFTKAPDCSNEFLLISASYGAAIIRLRKHTYSWPVFSCEFFGIVRGTAQASPALQKSRHRHISFLKKDD